MHSASRALSCHVLLGPGAPLGSWRQARGSPAGLICRQWGVAGGGSDRRPQFPASSSSTAASGQNSSVTQAMRTAHPVSSCSAQAPGQGRSRTASFASSSCAKDRSQPWAETGRGQPGEPRTQVTRAESPGWKGTGLQVEGSRATVQSLGGNGGRKIKLHFVR